MTYCIPIVYLYAHRLRRNDNQNVATPLAPVTKLELFEYGEWLVVVNLISKLYWLCIRTSPHHNCNCTHKHCNYTDTTKFQEEGHDTMLTIRTLKTLPSELESVPWLLVVMIECTVLNLWRTAVFQGMSWHIHWSGLTTCPGERRTCERSASSEVLLAGLSAPTRDTENMDIKYYWWWMISVDQNNIHDDQ